QLLAQRHLVRRGEPQASVLAREADTGETGVVELPLQLAGFLDLGQFLLVGETWPQVPDLVGRRARRQIPADPGPGAGPEVVDRLRLGRHDLLAQIGHDATSMVSTLAVRCS